MLIIQARWVNVALQCSGFKCYSRLKVRTTTTIYIILAVWPPQDILLPQMHLDNVVFGCWALPRNQMCKRWEFLLPHNSVWECEKTSSENIYTRSHCSKHWFPVEQTAIVATSLWFTACVLSSVLSEHLFTFESNQPSIIMITGLDLGLCSIVLPFYYLCGTKGLREHFKAAHIRSAWSLRESPPRNDMSLLCTYQSQPASFCLSACYYQSVRNVTIFFKSLIQ